MNNNDILKKLRVALQLKDTDIIEILNLVNFEITKGALNDLFRSEDHPNFVEAGDQIVRNFLNGLIIYKRGHNTGNKGDQSREKESAKRPNTQFDKNFFSKRKIERKKP